MTQSTTGGALYWEVGIDPQKFYDEVAKINARLRDMANNTAKEGQKMDDVMRSIGTAMAGYFSVQALAGFGKEIINVRGEFQQLGIAFETMLGSKEKADNLMAQAVEFAQKTPFTLTDVASNIKQLMAMGVAVDDVMGTMKSLGDVASGVSVPLERVAINYGQVLTLGTLQGRELRDFAMAGIPLLDELAKNLGKSKQEITEMISAGSIGFKDVEKAFQTMSGEGGKFANLMEKQMSSVTGQISNLKDKISLMMNSIGKSNDGLINSGISGLSFMIGHYEAIGEAVKGLLLVYGGYKGALMLVNSVEQASMAVIKEKKIALLESYAEQDKVAASALAKARNEAVAATELASIEAKKQAAAAKTLLAKEAAIVANEKLIASEKAYAISAAETSEAYSVGAVTEKQILLKKELSVIEKERIAAAKANATLSRAISSETILNANLEAAAVKKAEAEKVLATNAGIIAEREQAVSATIATGAEIRATQAKKLGAAAQELLNATMLNNPYVAAGAAIAAIGFGLYKWINYQTDLEKSLQNTNLEVANETDKVSELYAALKDTAEGTEAYKKAKKAIIDQYGAYIPALLQEKNGLDFIAESQKLVNKELEENIRLKGEQEAKANINTKANEEITSSRSKITDGMTGSNKYTAGKLVDEYVALGKVKDDTSEEAYSLFLALRDLGASEYTASKYVGNLSRALSTQKAELNSLAKVYSALEINKAEAIKKPEHTTVQQETKALQEKLKIEEKLLDSLKTKQFAKDGNKNVALDAVKAQEEVVKGLKDQLGIKEAAEKKNQENINKTNEELNQRHLANLEEFANFKAGISAGEIASQEESLQRELDLNNLAYEKREKEIEREKLQTLKLVNERDGNKPGSAKFASTLTGDEKLDYEQKIINAKKVKEDADLKSAKEWKEKIRAIWDEVYSSTLTGYEKEIQANKEKYDKMAKDARKANDPTLVTALERERTKAAEVITARHNLQMLDYQEQLEYKKNEIQANGFDREAKLVELNFQTWLATQKRRLVILEASTDEADKQEAAILKAAIAAGVSTNTLTKEERTRKIILSSAQQLVTAAGQYNAELGQALGSLLQMGTALDVVLTKGKNISKEDAAGMAVNGALQLVGLLVNSAAERKKAMTDYYASVSKQQMDYNILLNEQLRINNEIKGSIWIKDYEGKLNDSTKAYNNAQKQFADEYKKFQESEAVTGKKNVVSGTNVLAGVGAGAAMGAGIGALAGVGVFSWLTAPLGAAIGAVVGGVVGLFAKKSKDVTAPLLETYPKLISASGEFNIALAKTLVDTENITDATNDVLKNLIKWKEEADASRAQITEVIKDLTGSLGDDLRNALVKAFEDGTDASKAFGDSVNKTLDNIMSNMIFNAVFQPALKKLQDGLNASYGIGPDGKPITGDVVDGTWLDDFKTFMEQKQKLTEQFNTELQGAKDIAKASGMDILSNTSNASGMSGQIQRQITEETGSELVGLWNRTAIDIRETLTVSKIASTHLLMIEANTRRSADNTDSLTQLADMKASLKSIDTAVNKTASRL